jgi:TolB-like protein
MLYYFIYHHQNQVMVMSKKLYHSLAFFISCLTLMVGTQIWASPSTQQFESQITQATKKIADTLKTQSAQKEVITTVAVLPFKALDKGAKDLDLTNALSELLANHLSSQSGIINVERTSIDRIIGEVNRSRKGQISDASIAQAGKLMGARYVVVGSVSTLGAEIQVAIRVVASETGVITKALTLQAPRQNFVAFHKDVVVTKTRSGAIFRSMLLPGWGQLYNQDTYKGWITLSFTLTALTTAGIYGFLGSQAEAKYQENTKDTVPERAVANGNYQKARLALITGGVLWSYAVLDAFLTGKSSKKIDLKGWATPEGGGIVWGHQF